MPRFGQTFLALFRRLPFSDAGRAILRIFAEAFRRELLDLQTCIDESYDDIFITTAVGTALDNWGVVLELPRLPAEGDAAYRARLLVEWQTLFTALTIQAVTDVVDTLGGTYVPAISVDAVAEHYQDRLEDGVGAANNYDLGDRWGLARQDLLTFAVEIDRIPTQAEALALTQEIGTVRPAQMRGFLVVPLPAPAGTPPRYRLYGTSFSDNVAPWLWDDNFNAPPGNVTEFYQLINDGGGLLSWQFTATALFGDASQAAAGPGLCLPRQDLDPALLDYRDMYVDCSLRFLAVITADTAGIALRYDDVSGAFYAVAFHWTGATWQYRFKRYTGAAWVNITAWINTAADMTVYKRVQTWLEDQLWTLIIDGVVEENQLDIGADITTDGEWGFYTDGVANFDIYIDWWRMW